jgi:hypothetical protein
MSTLAAATLALLLAAEPTDVPPASAPPAGDALTAPLPASPPAIVPSGQPVAAVTASPAPSASTSKLGQVRAGLGVSVTNADDGFASTFQAGVQIDPWDHFGFRVGGGMTSSVVGAGGWDAAEFTGSVLFRPFGGQGRVAPYAGLGVQFALLAVFPDGEPLPQENLPRVGAGHLGVNFASARVRRDQPVQGHAGGHRRRPRPALARAGARRGRPLPAALLERDHLQRGLDHRLGLRPVLSGGPRATPCRRRP